MTSSPQRLTLGPLVAAFGLVLFMVSCTEDPLSLGPDTAPGTTTDIRDVTISAADLLVWGDTSVTGFATARNASFAFVSNEVGLQGRTLGRWNVPDTIETFVDTLPVEQFDSVNIRLRIDTIRSEFSDLPITLRIVQLARPFDDEAVTWAEAESGMPWTTPGGDLGVEIASAEFDGTSDTLFLMMTVDGDSLMKSWQDTDGGNGVAIVVEGPGSRIRVTQSILRFQAVLAGRTLPISRSLTMELRTFITDPPLPPTDVGLRIGGLPASRFYLDFEPPDTVSGVPLAEATINHAELILHPLPPPPAPFAAESRLSVTVISLLGDPFVLGAKTPIGLGGRPIVLEPDTLANGREFRIDVTLLIAQAGADSAKRRIRIGLRADPDAQILGYWEFGSVEAMPEFRPELRIILSPLPVFDVP